MGYWLMKNKTHTTHFFALISILTALIGKPYRHDWHEVDSIYAIKK